MPRQGKSYQFRCGFCGTVTVKSRPGKFCSRRCFRAFRASLDSSLSDAALIIVELRHKNPCLTLGQLGRAAGVTRERARRVLVKAGLETVRKRSRVSCERCGGPLRSGRKRFCCRACQTAATWVDVSCEVCGALFQLKQSHFIRRVRHGQQHFFCSKRCQGTWLGLHYGGSFRTSARQF